MKQPRSKMFAKIFLIIVTGLFFAMFGFMLIMPGVSTLSEKYINEKEYRQGGALLWILLLVSFSVGDLADDLAIVMVVAGSIIFFISFLGICGARWENKVCLSVHGITVQILFVGMITVVVFLAIRNAEVQKYIKDQMYSQLLNTYTYDDVSSDQVSAAWNYMFMGLQCCAVNAVTGTANDFDTTPWITKSNNDGKEIPIFCCSGIDENYTSTLFPNCTDTVSTGYYKVGCYDAISAVLQKYYTWFIVIGVTTLSLEALAVIFSFLICKTANKEKAKKTDSDWESTLHFDDIALLDKPTRY